MSRPKPYDMQAPLSDDQVYQLDLMLAELYDDLGTTSAAVAAIPTATTVAASAGIPGFAGADGEDGVFGPPGVAGAAGATGSTGAGGPAGQTIPGIKGDDGDDGMFFPGPQGATGATGAGASPTEFTVTTTGNIDDLDFSNANLIRMNNASLSTLRGLKAGTAGQVVTIVSIGAGQVDLAHQNVGSTAANRLLNLLTSGSMPLAAGFGVVTYQYDGTTGRWRLIDFDQGSPITPTFASGNFAAASGTWTLAAGDVNTLKYVIRQSGSMLLTWDLRTTTTSLSTTNLEMKLPGGFSTAGTQTYTNWYETAGVAGGATREQVSVGSAFAYSVFFNILAGTNWGAETDTIGVRGSAEILIV